MIRRIYKAIRLLIVLALLLCAAVPAVLYVGLSLPVVQNYATTEVGKRLSNLLGVNVEVDNLAITPFNRATLRNVVLTGAEGDTIAKARKLGAGFGFTDLLFHHKLVLNYVEALELDLRIHRDSIGRPLNIDPVLAHLNKPGGDGGVPDLRINTIVIRKSKVSYDVLKAPRKPLGEFDVNHVSVCDLRADLRVALDKEKRLIAVDLRRIAAEETHSGLNLSDLQTKAVIRKAPAPSGAIASVDLLSFELSLPESKIMIAPTTLAPGDDIPVAIDILAGSHITPSDLAAVIPDKIRGSLTNILDSRVDLTMVSSITRSDVKVESLNLAVSRGAITIDAPQGLAATGLDSIAAAHFSLPLLRVSVNPSASQLMPFPIAGADTLTTSVLPLTATIEGDGDMRSGGISANFTSRDAGNASISLEYRLTPDRRLNRIEGNVDTENLGLSAIASAIENAIGKTSSLSWKLPRRLTATVEGRAVFIPDLKLPDGAVSVSISSVTLPRRNGTITTLDDILLDVSSERGLVEATFESANDGFALTADITADIESRTGNFDIALDDLDLSLKGGEHISMTAFGSLSLQPSGASLPATGDVSLRDIRMIVPGTEKGLSISKVEISSVVPTDSLTLPYVNINSDILTATVTGSVNPATISSDVKRLAAELLPEVIDFNEATKKNHTAANDFALNARIITTAPIEEVVKLPVQVRYPVEIKAALDAPGNTAMLDIDAPYLWQGKKEIDSTTVSFSMAGRSATIGASTLMPTKNGQMNLGISASLPEHPSDQDSLRSLSTAIVWDVDASRDFSGSVSFGIIPQRDPDNNRQAMATIDFHPSELTFNDTVWTMDPSRIIARKNKIEVKGFKVGRTGQYVEIDGIATASTDDRLSVMLKDIDLDYVFETLNIPNAMFGGIATGEVFAAGLLGKDLVAYTPDLFVRGLKYNFSLMGDTHIKASFDPEAPAVNINAKVDQPNGLNSYITGYIKPTSEGYIDLNFTADKIEVGFMKPFMSAFASAVHGYASGTAHLFGTFHDVNMSGDIFAEDLSLALDFTGTTYWATDSVHLTPGHIDLNGITLRDREGHTARLGGYLRHTNFHEPRFQFRITDADDLLVYDLPESSDRQWSGTIYGDGSAIITGVPGHIDIGVDMSTAPRSSFTFILSDAEEAYDYNFITFRDRNSRGRKDEMTADMINGIPVEVVEMRKALAKKTEEEGSSIYDMDITVRANPDAQLTVVMDPIGGDAIKARGNGDMTLTYNSASEDLGLRGDYTLDNGTYNFTFQDIIRKDFRINPGSTIRFTGDPYAAQLDIEAAYRLTANLSDLDESFLDDPELTRTSVPVDALINVTGDMRAPDIAYDFAFPTLKDDIKRKVNSIVSTDEMRARQMLYLLALNRFYTPEYMSATKGNELFSVASSTISSQISNLLGSLSENWTIAPNLRSDRGDFSDVEFDLALSSSLLNNRLLFNGNFGYRDKSLNNNTFIGDFDLEYLLNRSGSLRLKAYNRYNDQNFYVKNALTTQGVGIVFRRDFDSLTSWLRTLRRKKNDEGKK